MKFLELYEKWMKAGRLPEDGLCDSLPAELIKSEAWELIEPDVMERWLNSREGGGYNYWGMENLFADKENDFTPQRQTIMLVAAALNGEFD